VSVASGQLAPDAVRRMFDRIAPVYDAMNRTMTAGLDGRWRRLTAEAVVRSGDRVLDACCGTGDLAIAAASAGAASVTGLDFSEPMLERARRKAPGLAWVRGDVLALPFADASFDAVTISFGLRNVADPDAALRELLRVTRPGGRLVVCEFSHPTFPAFRTVYVEYLMRALPPIARTVSSSPDAYVYLAESIRAWPDQRRLASRIAGAGWRDPEWRNLSGGIVALHRATA
jgi:demethylmenaquinone methyltransferase/2-methoxy-6-polyprenyl-1,4-benzoquinol methylase